MARFVILVLSLLSSGVFAQIQIDSIRLRYRNIPMSTVGGSVSPHNLDYFFNLVSVSGDTVTGLSSSTNVSITIRIDTSLNRIYDCKTYFEFGNLNETWGTHTTFLRTIGVAKAGSSYRGFREGAELASDLSYVIYLKKRTGIDSYGEEYISSQPNRFTDSSSAELLLYGNVPLGVSKGRSSQPFRYHPNPAHSYIEVQLTEPATTAVLTDMLGRTVRTFAIDDVRSQRLSLQEIIPGPYYLHIGGRVQPIIVQ